MKTPFLDNEIRRINKIHNVNLSDSDMRKLDEFERIKDKLSLHNVSKRYDKYLFPIGIAIGCVLGHIIFNAC